MTTPNPSEAPFLTTTRAAYHAAAADYADIVVDRLAQLPIERALLTAFAELVRASGNHRVADVGCGPGHVTRMLDDLGVEAFGIDLAPGMVDLARRSNPGLRFEVGSMLDLDLPDGELGGLLAFYSIIHIPWESRARAFAEFHRVLAPGGQLMLGFQIGDEIRHIEEMYGHTVDLHSYRQQPDEVAALLREAGFTIRVVTRTAEAEAPLPHGDILAIKPES